MRTTRITVVLAAQIVAISCADASLRTGSDKISREWKTERITRGDTTVVRTRGAGSEKAVVLLEQELSIGTVNGADEEMLSEVEYVTPAPNGDIYFFDGGGSSVRRFDSTGRYLHSIGTKGRGPGEYVGVYKIDLTPDGGLLLEADKTLNLYDAAGKSVVDRNILFADLDVFGSQRAVTSDGLIHVSRRINDQRYPDSTVDGERVTATAAHRLTIKGEPLDTVYAPQAVHPAGTLDITRPGTSIKLKRAIPLAQTFLTAYSSLGYWISGGDSGKYAITLHRREGGPLRIEADMPQIKAEQAERESLHESFTNNLRRSDKGLSPELKLIPEQKRHFKSLRTDVDGRIWVEVSQPGIRVPRDTSKAGEARAASQGGVAEMITSTGQHVMIEAPIANKLDQWREPLAYDVFAPTGEFLGRVKLPERSTWGNAIGDKLWLIVLNEDDVQTLVRFRVKTSAGEEGAGWK